MQMLIYLQKIAETSSQIYALDSITFAQIPRSNHLPLQIERKRKNPVI